MTYYFKKVNQLMDDCYSNRQQLQDIIAARHFINHNIERELSLELLSDKRAISKFHFLRLFKKFYGQTPKQYIIDQRIQKAKELLKKGNSISDTCYDVGFDSPSSFSTLFKSRVGCSPRTFQKEQLSQSKIGIR